MALLGDVWSRWFVGKRGRPTDENGVRTFPVRPAPRRAFDRHRADGKPEAPIFPSFKASAIDRPQTRGESDQILRARLLLRDIFTPTQPVTQRARFAGRLAVLSKLISTIEEQRSHVVVYGERGIGKTSLMHILADVARESHYLVVYASCGASSRFDEIFRAVLSDIPMLYLSTVAPTAAAAETGGTLADRLPPEGFDARQLGDLCAEITGTRILIILDEYDRVQDPDFRQSVAELIKNLSDRAARVQLLIAGVASNLQELVGYIPSIRRNIIGLPMARLTDAEVRAMIAIGEDNAGVRFANKVVEMITLLANGSPYLARLLSHHASMNALDEMRMTVETSDIQKALDGVVEEAEGRIARHTEMSLAQLLNAFDREFVGAAARAASTADGWFMAEHVARYLPAGSNAATCAAELERIAGSSDMLEHEEAPDGVRYRFNDEALPTYLWMKIARDHFQGNAGRK